MTLPPGTDLGPFASLAEDLQEITEALAATSTEREVIAIVLTPAVRALGAVAGIVLLVDQTDQQMKIAGSQGYESGTPTVWQEGPIEDHVLIADILRMREALYFEHAGALKEAYPELESRTGGLAAIANATLPMFLDDQPLGVIVLDFKEPHHFSPAERHFLKILSAQCAIALGRTRLLDDLERQVATRTRQLENQARAQEAFVAFTEAVGTNTDLLALAQQAITVLRARFHDATIVYYTRDGDLWKAQAWSEDLSEALVVSLTAGLPSSTPLIRRAINAGTAVFTNGWDAEQEQIEHSEAYSTAAGFPLTVDDEIRHLVLFGLKDTPRWTERDQSLVRAVGRSLTLAVERAHGVAQLAQRTQELERSNTELEQFAYIASHDLQAPIRAVTSFAGIIHKRYGDSLDERGQLYLRQIMESGEHMKRLVDDLLAFSRVHTEQQPLLPTDAENVFDAVASRLQTSGVTLIRSALPVVQTDGQQLDQLLQNLISNGLKYRREGVVPEVEVTAQRDGAWWRFAVSDNGIGIEPQYYERIFEIFQRLHGRESYEGTGIGLAVCKKIVERHGGQLWLESVPGKGSTFFFTLPEA
ncbi:ATP-binding protein [Deinococcus sp. QL22]|uniref:sensor histidine kinase n=1 Tax=Deinococcus sp. QL22 TaxID=2939437 RepID=UPI002017A4B4|nr:ATP-binding protein [Deinococcus sp. QL22]UQN10839.1 ATP-binding protein [Deinococcus sp. QL22]